MSLHLCCQIKELIAVHAVMKQGIRSGKSCDDTGCAAAKSSGIGYIGIHCDADSRYAFPHILKPLYKCLIKQILFIAVGFFTARNFQALCNHLKSHCRKVVKRKTKTVIADSQIRTCCRNTYLNHGIFPLRWFPQRKTYHSYLSGGCAKCPFSQALPAASALQNRFSAAAFPYRQTHPGLSH